MKAQITLAFDDANETLAFMAKLGAIDPAIVAPLASSAQPAAVQESAAAHLEEVLSRPDTPAPSLRQRITDVLNDTSKYSMRTLAGLAEALGVSADDVYRVLDDMMDDDNVRTLTRRRDGMTLYQAA